MKKNVEQRARRDYGPIPGSLPCVALVAATAIMTMPAYATSMPESGRTTGFEEWQGIEEIVVTARRREEGVQSVPIAISALSGDQLEDRQILSIDQLGSAIPNLQYDKAAPSSGSSSVGQIFIRGIGQSDFTPVTDPGVALYIDGVYFGRSIGNVLDLIDVERVEVLRGPQGTLFGRNSIGGAIKVHSSRPTSEQADNRLRVRLGDDNLAELAYWSNLPLGENGAAGLALSRITRDGYVERLSDGVRTGDRDRWSARGSLSWTPREDLETFLVVDFTEIDENGAPTVSGGVNDRQAFGTFGNALLESCTSIGVNPGFDGTPAGGPPTFPPPGAADGGATGCYGPDSRPGPYLSEASFPTASRLDNAGAAVEIDWTISDQFSLKSTTGFRSIRMLSSRDGDNTPANIFATRDDYDHEQVSEEVQLEFSNRGQSLNGLFGVFYYDESGFNLVDVTLPTGAIQSGGYYDNQSYAVFLHTTLDVTDRLAVSVGGRYTRDRKAYLPDQLSLGDASAGSEPGFFSPTWPNLEGFYLAPTGPLAAGERILDFTQSKLEFSKTDWSVDVKYWLRDRVMAYVSYSTGYKSGGFDQRFVGPTPDRRPSTYRPETVDSLEIGLKTATPNERLRMNLALFDADYDDLQIIVRESFNPLTFNAGRARVRGGELEFTWVPTSDWAINLSVGHLDAAYRTLTDSAQASGVRLDNQLVNAPEWSLAAGAAYSIDLGSRGAMKTRLDWSWQSEQFSDAINSPEIRQPPVQLLNASLEWLAANERWRVSLASRNLLDETYLVTGNSAFTTAASYVEQVYGRGRELFLTLDYDF
ncbi:MAG: TonB-dependent receptor [Woeseiaceae bacterium]|nr:TonB-dependent receptor [Woeseiaceae bacterium]